MSRQRPVVDKGSVHSLLPYHVQAIKHGLQDLGCSSLEELHRSLTSVDTRMELRSRSAIVEGGVHDLLNVPCRV